MRYLHIILIAVIIVMGLTLFSFARKNNQPVQAAGGVVTASISNNSGNPLIEAGLSYYLEKNDLPEGTPGIEPVLRNFGCHQEVHFFKEGTLDMRLVFLNGQIFEY